MPQFFVRFVPRFSSLGYWKRQDRMIRESRRARRLCPTNNLRIRISEVGLDRRASRLLFQQHC